MKYYLLKQPFENFKIIAGSHHIHESQYKISFFIPRK